jgi:hypothetical protein
MQTLAAATNHYCLKFMASPSYSLTDKCYSNFTMVSDLYNLQAHGDQSTCNTCVHNPICKQKAVHTGMPISAESSTVPSVTNPSSVPVPSPHAVPNTGKYLLL